MSKYKSLQQQYPQARIRKLVTTTREGKGTLDLTDRWILSCLWFKFAGEAVSIRRLMKFSHLDKSKTLPKRLNRLVSLGLVSRTGKKWIAIKPTDLSEENQGFFSWHNSSGKPRLAYEWIVRLRGKSLLHSCLFFRRESTAKLSKWFQCSKKTVQRNRKKDTSVPETYSVENTKTIKITQDKPMKIEKTTIEEALNISEEAIPLVEKYKRLTIALSPKEQNQSLSRIIEKVGPGEGLADYLSVKLPSWNRLFYRGVTYGELLKEIA